MDVHDVHPPKYGFKYGTVGSDPWPVIMPEDTPPRPSELEIDPGTRVVLPPAVIPR